MRRLFLLILMSLMVRPVFSQTPQKDMSKQEMQHQIAEPIKLLKDQIADLEKQIAEAKKNKGDSESLNELEDELAKLKKQLALMEGVNKNLSNMSDKTIQRANEEETGALPKRDVARINKIPKEIRSDRELTSFVQTVVTDVQNQLPFAEKTEALKIYDQIKTKYKSANATANAASGCWMFGNMEKALFIMGKSCLDDITDPDNLNNYAAFLLMAGAEEKALPILQYLNRKYPDNSTILNNTGQAWFGLGDITNAEKYFNDATALYENHSQANLTLSRIYKLKGDTAKAIVALKKSLKESYSTEKEGEITQLDGTVDEEDITLGVPWESDPTGSEALFDIKPVIAQSLSDVQKARKAWSILSTAMVKEKERLENEEKIRKEKAQRIQDDLINNKPFKQKKLKSKSNLYKKANRKVITHITSPVHGDSPLAKEIQDHMNLYGSILYDLRLTLTYDIAKIEDKYRPCGQPNACAEGWAMAKCNEIKDAENNYLGKAFPIITNNYEWERNFYKSYREAIINYSKYGQIDESPWNLQMTVDEMKTLAVFELIQRDVLMGYEGLSYSTCSGTSSDDLLDPKPPIVRTKEPSKCDFYKRINFIVGGFEVKCNEQMIQEWLIKYKGENSPLGSLQMGQNKQGSKSKGPLKAEAADAGSSSVELNQSGIGDIKEPLSKDGTKVADPASTDTGIQDRMSWNAAAGGWKFLTKR